MRFVISQRAETNLISVADYLNPISPQGARSVSRVISATLHLLRHNPRLGLPTSEPNIFYLPTKKHGYLVYFERLPAQITVVAIRHHAQERLFESEKGLEL